MNRAKGAIEWRHAKGLEKVTDLERRDLQVSLTNMCGDTPKGLRERKLQILKKRSPGVVDEHVVGILGLANLIESDQTIAISAAKMGNHIRDVFPHLWPVRPGVMMRTRSERHSLGCDHSFIKYRHWD